MHKMFEKRKEEFFAVLPPTIFFFVALHLATDTAQIQVPTFVQIEAIGFAKSDGRESSACSWKWRCGRGQRYAAVTLCARWAVDQRS